MSSIMMVLRKISLTLCAVTFLGAYSVTHALIKRIRPKFKAQVQGTSDIGWATLPSEIQNIIIDEVVCLLNDKEMLDLSLTCKQFEKRISSSPIWYSRPTPLFSSLPAPAIFEACSKLGFSKKIAYFFANKKLINVSRSWGQRSFQMGELSSISYHNSRHYVPWLVNNFFKSPGTFWKFLKTIIVDPTSIYKFLVQEDVYNSIVRTHIPTIDRIGPHVKILGVVLSLLPWIDLFLAKSPIVAAIGSADSLKNFFETIWSFDAISIWTIMHMSLPLLFGALLDNVFYYSDLVPYQALMVIITALFNKGLKTAIILGCSTVLPAILYQRFAPRNYLWWAPPWILMLLPWLYFNPIVFIYFLLIVVAVVWDMAQRGLRPSGEKMNFAKWFLLFATTSAISAVAVAVLK